MSSECNDIKLAIRNDKSKVVCAMCKKCLISVNHDVCVLNYVNGMKARGKKQKAKGSNIKFLGTVRFGNDHVVAILGFSDLQWGNILITKVYFVEGLGHNLFSVGQFCDSDLEHPKWVVDGDEGDGGDKRYGDEVEVMVVSWRDEGDGVVAAMVVMVLGVEMMTMVV
ncbi:hypothetical protein Tco_0996305 [Tanacetum coccineum]